jgi:hypothetical protein
MAENLNLNVKVDTSQADASVGSLKKQLREAQQEVMALSDKFGATSKEAINAAKKAAELKDRIGDAKALTDAFNPDAKFKALTSSLSGVAGGFGAVQGAMALFGVESEHVQKTLLRVQSAMAISQGLQAVGESIDSFKQLGAVIQNSTIFQKANNAATVVAATVQRAFTGAVAQTSLGFQALKGAIAATGIGLLVVGLGSLISAITSWVSSTEEAEAAQRNLNSALKEQNELTNTQVRLSDYNSDLAIAKARRLGKSQEEINKLENSKNAERLKYLEIAKDKAEELYQTTARNQLISDEDAAKAEENRNKARDAYHLEYQRQTLQSEQAWAKSEEDKRKKTKEENEKSIQLNKERKKIEEQLQKEKDDAEIEATKKLVDLKNQIYLNGIEDENKARKIAIGQQLFKEAAEINANEKLKAETKQALIIELRKKAQLEIDEIDKKEAKDKKEKEEEFQKELEKLKLEIRLSGIKDEYEKSKAQIESNYQLQYKDIDKNEKYTAEQKLALKLALQQKENQELDKLKVDKDNLKIQDDKKKAADDIAELDREIAKNVAKFDIERQLLDKKDLLLKQSFKNGLIKEQEYNAGVEANAKARADIDKAETQAKIENAQKISALLSGLSDVVGKETAAGKAFAIASATIDTYLAAQKAYQSMAGIPIVGPALGAVAAGVAIAGGIKNVKAIMAVKTPSGGGGGSTPAMPNVSTSAPMTPAAPTAQTTNISQQSINQLGNQAVKAYVIESDVTSNQQRIEAIRQRARFS